MLVKGKGKTPLYAQVADFLRSQIEDGELCPDDRIPSEPELAEQYGISRATSSKALDLLEEEGLVQRKQGRGTFVQPPRLKRPLPELTSFTEHVTEVGRTPSHCLISAHKLPAEQVDSLAAPFEAAQELVVLRRLRLVDDEPVGVHRTLLPAELAERIGLTEERLKNKRLSLYALFQKHNVELVSAEEHLQARTASEEFASLLNVDVGEPLIHVRRFSYDGIGQPVEAVDASYISRRYDYYITLVRRTD